MKNRYELLNKLYQWIVLEQAGSKIPKEVLDKEPALREIKNAVSQVAAKLCYVTGQNKYETQVALAKLFTAGLVEFERGDDGEFRLKAVSDPDLGILEEYNDNLKG